MNATEYFKAGELEQATLAALQEVKANPAEVGRRCFLSDLLCFAGDLERADRQLDAAAQLGPTPAVLLRRQLLRAEQSRRLFFSEGRLPELLRQPNEDLRLRLRAAIALREEDLPAAGKLLTLAEHCRPAVRALCNGKLSDNFSDLDELASSFFEVYTATGKYYWVGFEQVRALDFFPPQTVQDLLWRCARLNLCEEDHALSGIVYLPVLYPGSHLQRRDELRLGRLTEWLGGGTEPFRGLGQKLFQAGAMEVPILELTRLEFSLPRET